MKKDWKAIARFVAFLSVAVVTAALSGDLSRLESFGLGLLAGGGLYLGVYYGWD